MGDLERGDWDRADLARGELPSAPLLSFEGVGTPSFGVPSGLNCDIPAATAVLVCTHLRKGLVCMTILRFFFFGRDGCDFGASRALNSRWARSALAPCFAASASSVSCWCRRAAMRRPSDLACDQPPYVRGGSYGVGDVRCHDLSEASRRAPCLCRLSASHSSVNECMVTNLAMKTAAGPLTMVAKAL